MEPKSNDKSGQEINLDEKPFCERLRKEIEEGQIDDRGFYTTPNGSFWDDDHTYFNHLGFDIHGGFYDKYGVYYPGPNYDEKTGLYIDQQEYISSSESNIKKDIEITISKLKEEEKNDEKIIKKYEQPVEDSEVSDEEDKSNVSFDENDIEEAFNSVMENMIVLGEILNPQIYTGIVERDFHLYSYTNFGKQPDYVHLEADSKPKCTCQMEALDLNEQLIEKCKHILFVLNDILNLDIEREELIYKEEELEKAFKEAENKNKNIIRETYGITNRKNFVFPNPKEYKYEYNEDNDEDGYESHEWRIKERLYSRGIVASEFHYSDNDYSETEERYNKFFYSEKDAKPTHKAFEKPVFSGKQLKLDKKFKEDEKYD